jgi:hypothetical protein
MREEEIVGKRENARKRRKVEGEEGEEEEVNVNNYETIFG